MELGLKGKSVVVLASAGGIGKGVATEFAREGARVTLFDREEAALKAAQQDILDITGERTHAVAGDITKAQDIERLFAEAKSSNGPVFALFNNTGGPAVGTFDKFADKEWQAAFELTLLAYVRAIRAAIPQMKELGGGRIVCNTSSSIKRVLDNLILSNVFRMGIVGLCKTLARELGPGNILVNIIGPGKIGTKRTAEIDAARAKKEGRSLEEMQKIMAAAIPLKRYGTPEELGRLVAFLCSEANTYVSGQSILVDGAQVEAY